MNFKYFPHTPDDMATMLSRCGVTSVNELFADVPEAVRVKGDYDLPEPMSEVELRQWFNALGAKNTPLTCFAGAGVYDHYVPAVVPSIAARSEFLTSYTPYQQKCRKARCTIYSSISR